MDWPIENDRYYEPVPPAEIGEFVDGDLQLVLCRMDTRNSDVGWVDAYVFRMVERQSGTSAGLIQLRLGVTEELLFYGGQIGFGVDEAFRGRRYAARSVRMLLPLAARVGMKELWITCDPANIASKRSIEIAGGVWVDTRSIASNSRMYAEGHRAVSRFRFDL